MNWCGNPGWSGTKSLQLIPKKDGSEPRFVVLVPEIKEYKKKPLIFERHFLWKKTILRVWV
jgi:hypothetical protein